MDNSSNEKPGQQTERSEPPFKTFSDSGAPGGEEWIVTDVLHRWRVEVEYISVHARHEQSGDAEEASAFFLFVNGTPAGFYKTDIRLPPDELYDQELRASGVFWSHIGTAVAAAARNVFRAAIGGVEAVERFKKKVNGKEIEEYPALFEEWRQDETKRKEIWLKQILKDANKFYRFILKLPAQGGSEAFQDFSGLYSYLPEAHNVTLKAKRIAEWLQRPSRRQGEGWRGLILKFWPSIVRKHSASHSHIKNRLLKYPIPSDLLEQMDVTLPGRMPNHEIVLRYAAFICESMWGGKPANYRKYSLRRFQQIVAEQEEAGRLRQEFMDNLPESLRRKSPRQGQ